MAGTIARPKHGVPSALSKTLTKPIGTMASRVMDLLRRRNSHTKSHNQTSYRPQLLDLILALPTELQIAIFQSFSTNDLLAFRLISKPCAALIHTLGPALARHFIRTSLPPLMLKLYPAPPPGGASLKYMLDMEHRLSVSRHVAAQLCQWFAEPGLRRRKTRKAAEKRYQALFRAVVPLVFTLNHFFEQYRGLIIERAVKSARESGRAAAAAAEAEAKEARNGDGEGDGDGQRQRAQQQPQRRRQPQKFRLETGGPTLWDDQTNILSKYHPQLMLECYHVYGYLLHVFECRLTPGRLARLRSRITLRGSLPFPSTPEVEVLLMLGGLRQMHRVLAGKRYKARRRTLDEFVGGLDPKRNPAGWRGRWREALGQFGDDDNEMEEEVVDRLTLRLPALHLVWVPCALQLLLGSKVIHNIDFSSDSMARDPAEFIVDLIGWNWAGQGGGTEGGQAGDASGGGGHEHEIEDGDGDEGEDDEDDDDGTEDA